MADEKVEIPFVLKDGVTGALGAMRAGFHKTEQVAERLGDRMREVGRDMHLSTVGILGVGLGLGEMISHAKHATDELNRTSKSLTNLFATSLNWDKGVSLDERFDKSRVAAKELAEELDDIGARWSMGMEDMGRAYQGVAVATRPLGLSQEKVLELTTKTAAAAKAYGMSVEDVSDKMVKALTFRTVGRGTDPLTQALKQQFGKNLGKMTAQQILEGFDKAFVGVEGRADKMSLGIGDSIFKIQNVVEDTMRDITGPLFGEVSKSIAGMAADFRKVGKDGKSSFKEISQDLVTGFGEVKRVTAEIAPYWKEIGGAALALQGIKMAGGATEMMGLGAGVKQFSTKLAGASTALVLFAVGLEAAVSYFEKKHKDAINDGALSTKGGTFDHVLNRLGMARNSSKPGGGAAGRDIYQQLNSVGLLQGGKLDNEKFISSMRGNPAMMEKYGEAVGMNPWATRSGDPTMIANEIAQKLGAVIGPMMLAQKSMNDSWTGPINQSQGEVPNNFKANRDLMLKIGKVVIEQKFEEADPGRVFERFKEDLEQHVVRPTQSIFADYLGE